ncbi:type IX secretion system sortase PorU [candidate division KSB1 bacterium]|nr:type IX secretion system sortase PorU [candidate division KSB1 bacterium]
MALRICAMVSFCMGIWCLAWPGQIRSISNSDTDLVLEITPGLDRIDTLSINNQQFLNFYFDDHQYPESAGSPSIPFQKISLGIPPRGDINFTILDIKTTKLTSSNIAPVPELVKQEIGSDYRYAIDRNHPGWSRPNQPVKVGAPYWFRGQRMADLRVSSILFDPASEIELITNIRIRISFPSSSPTITRISKDESLYRALVFNYDQARGWRQTRSSSLTKSRSRIVQTGEWLKIIIRGDGLDTMEGIYKIDGKTLSEAGFPTATLDPSTLQLFNNGGRELPRNVETSRPDSLIENPIRVIGAEDGRLDPADYILFYGRSLTGVEYDSETGKWQHYIHHYSHDNVYWLRVGQEKGLRMAEMPSQYTPGMAVESSFRDLVFIEQELHNLLHSGFEWFGPQLNKQKATVSQPLNMPDAIPGAEAEFRFRMASHSKGSHSYSFACNGNPLGSLSLSGHPEFYYTGRKITKDTGSLQAGQNTLSIRYHNPQDISVSYVDWMEIEYDRAFFAQNDQLIFNAPLRSGAAAYEIPGFSRSDIQVYDITDIHDIRKITQPHISGNTVRFTAETDPEHPRRLIALTPGAYRNVTEIKREIPDPLRTPNDIDYIIITHDDFYSEALKLEGLRETLNPHDRLQTEVVKISHIIDSFSWGIPDALAVRDFLVFADQHWDHPQYVLLFGDGHYDYKSILKTFAPNLILPFETLDNTEFDSRPADDWFVYTQGAKSGVQMAIGRLPVQTPEQAHQVVEKIIAYETSNDAGSWRKTITTIADDELHTGGKVEYELLHTSQSEDLAEHHTPALLDVQKIYLVEYPAVRTASVSGVTKPAATSELLECINKGSLIINYIGHGNDELWSHERLLVQSTHLDAIETGPRQALWFAATCSFGWWDQTQRQSFAENILLKPEQGAIASISSARESYSHNNAYFNTTFYDFLFSDYPQSGQTLRIGDAILLAKHKMSSRTTTEKYHLFGDPAMRLRPPKHKAVIDTMTPDSLQALSKTMLSGHIEKEHHPWSSFQGEAFVKVLDARSKKTYTSDVGQTVSYSLPGNPVFQGNVPVENGRFNTTFIVPKDIHYGGTDGRISLYFHDDQAGGTGVLENIPVGGTAIDLVDHQGPEITCRMRENPFAPGDFINPTVPLTIRIADSLSGINIAGDIGHQITVTFDDQESEMLNVTDQFHYDADSYTTGQVILHMPELDPGEHTLRIKAWDNSNNSSILDTWFTLVSDSSLTIRNLLNYPNPMTDETQFTFEISQDSEVRLRIFTATGRLICEMGPFYCPLGFNTLPVTWDATDQDGDPIANGLYFYKLDCHSQWNENETVSKIGKVIVAR